LFGARTGDMRFVLDDMKDAETGENIESCPHPQQMILIKTPGPVEAGDMMRKRTAKGEENAI